MDNDSRITAIIVYLYTYSTDSHLLTANKMYTTIFRLLNFWQVKIEARVWSYNLLWRFLMLLPILTQCMSKYTPPTVKNRKNLIMLSFSEKTKLL